MQGKTKPDPALSKQDDDRDEEKGQQIIPPAPFMTLFRGADSFDYFLMALGSIGAMMIGCALPIFSILFGDIMDGIGQGKSIMRAVNQALMYILYLGIASFIGGYLESAFWAWTAQRQARRLREQYLKSALVQNVAFFDTQASTGGLLQTLSSDTLQIQKVLGDKTGLTIHNLAMAVGGIAIGFAYSWDITLVILGVMPLLAAAGFVIARVTTVISGRMASAYSEASSAAQDGLSNIRTVAAFNMQETILERYVQLLEMPLAVNIQQGRLAGIAVSCFNLALFGAWGIGLYYGAVAVSKRGYSGGDVVAAFFAVINAGFGVGQALPNFTSFVEARSAIARLLAVIDKKPDYSVATPGKEPESIKGEIEFQSVSFAYPSRPTAMITRGLNLRIEATQKVALVGGSGSGKSTVIALIQRWYDPLQGKVLLDGVDIRDLNLGWLRNHMGLVSQEPTLFATSIRENILFGRQGATQQEVEEAAKAANIHKFVLSLPGGYESMVGERGVQLSGGQKQRIAIARAILRSPKVLLLDEATSALDAASEKVVQATLDQVMVGRTTIVVAHRLSTVRGADKICVVREGAVVEQGTHQELLDIEGGAYQALIKLQNLAGMESDDAPPASLEDVDAVPASLGPAYSDKPEDKARHSLDVEAALVAHPAKKGWWQGGKKEGDKQEASSKDGQEAEEKEIQVPMSRLLKLNKSEWPQAVIGVIASGATGMAMPAAALLMSEGIATYYLPDRDEVQRRALKWLWIFIACGVGVGICAYLQQYLFTYMGSKLARRVREMLMRSLIYQDIAWFDDDRNNSAALVARLGTDALNVKGAVGDSMAVMSAAIVGMTFCLTLAFVLSWNLALVILATVPFMIVAGVIQMKFATQQGGQSDEQLAAATQTASEAFQAIRTVQAYCMEDGVVAVYHGQQEEPVRGAVRSAQIAGAGFGYSMACIMGVYGLAFWYGAKQVEKGEITFGDMLKVIFVILMGSMGVTQAQAMFPDMGKAKAAIQNVFRTLDRKPIIDASSSQGLMPHDLKGSISLENIVFAYPSRPTLNIFNGFSLDIPAGQTVAVVGESGSGKSTVISLVLRLYDPMGGSVLVDGLDIRSFNLKALRAQIGLVQQEPILFNTTIRQNILMGRPDASDSELESASRAANAHDFIVGTPQGYDTPVGERGGQLSGGQKQRIAIARAVLRNPRILLLDEATSALDATSEALVQEALDGLMQGRTTIVVAHRLSTVRNADCICVVQTGVLVEQGTHEALVAHNGAYAALVKAQMRGAGGASMKQL